MILSTPSWLSTLYVNWETITRYDYLKVWWMILECSLFISWAAKQLRNNCIEVVCVCVCVCVYVCPSAVTLTWHNIVNSQCIAIQLYMRVDTPGCTLLLRTTAFVTTLYVAPKALKCDITITNYQIALKCHTGITPQKVHTQHCQWLDKHPTAFVTTLSVSPNSFKYNISMNNVPWIIVRLL